MRAHGARARVVHSRVTRAGTTTTEACRKRTIAAGSRIQQRSSTTPASGLNVSGGRSPRAPGCAGEPSCGPHGLGQRFELRSWNLAAQHVELVAQYKDHASSTEQEARNSPRVPTTVEIIVS